MSTEAGEPLRDSATEHVPGAAVGHGYGHLNADNEMVVVFPTRLSDGRPAVGIRVDPEVCTLSAMGVHGLIVHLRAALATARRVAKET